uniref:Alpha/beta hydrolase fold-3 domain-containing protein n=1 Tax=Oryza punctata TaxID=4537 RepID=A0A0E0M229_ORYPU
MARAGSSCSAPVDGGSLFGSQARIRENMEGRGGGDGSTTRRWNIGVAPTHSHELWLKKRESRNQRCVFHSWGSRLPPGRDTAQGWELDDASEGFRGLYVATPKALSPERLICCHTTPPSPNPHLSMSINGGATVSAGWVATQPRRRRTVDHSSGSCLLRPSYGSTKGFGTRRIAVRSASQKNSSPPSMTTEQEADDEVVLESPAHFRIYKSGKIDRLNRPPVLPAGLDEATGVTSKDVVLDADTGVSVRLFLPKLQEPSKKLPVIVFFHGGAFFIESAGSETYHNYVNSLAAAAGVLVVSVDYRLAPEHPLPTGYDDSWAALQWAASAQDGWIAEHGDTARLFVAGDSAGANIAHEMLVRAAANGGRPRMEGAILLHPWFGGSKEIEGEPEGGAAITAAMWYYACPGAAAGADDPRLNPLAPGGPALEELACERMLVCAGGKDVLAARNRAYYDAVAASAWSGSAAWLESEGEGHVFFLGNPECENGKQLMDRIVAFIAGG